MSITFKSISKKNPRDLTAPKKFYASSISNGTTELETLADLISSQCTVTSTDCVAVLNALEENVIRELKQGRIVKLGKLGDFQVSLSSEGFDTEEEETAKAIKKARIIFRPSVGMRNLLSTLTYRKRG
ncbi:HU family DNA-binding protein [Tenacibaculum sp. M341]|uniref:HU family DNA-binding protein n=1 Tax=Tenacibaculum sp. M341 TaxID=2530339 RepID=UPI00104F4939|nr:HU family DNA-binding protein [Tenacibaculum sp. M341]TCI90300.1 DNA-binding protein [Tenacibaculum sp. M341]